MIEVVARVQVLVADVTACAHAIAAVGVNIDIEAEVKADIAAKVAALISVSCFCFHELTFKLIILTHQGYCARMLERLHQVWPCSCARNLHPDRQLSPAPAQQPRHLHRRHCHSRC